MFVRKIAFLLFTLILPSFCLAQRTYSGSEAFGDQLTVGYVAEMPAYLNPVDVNDLVQQQIARMVFGTGLIQQPDRFGYIPALVDRFIFPKNDRSQGRVWKYVIKRNINFHNGIPLRNSDIQFTFNMLKKWGGNILNRPIDFSNIEAIQTSGDLEVNFVLKQKDLSFDEKLTDIPIFSRNYYQGIDQDGFDLLKKVQPLGFGPFQYLEQHPDEIILVPHSHYIFGRPFIN
ncbi:MAG: ABC transporter substrate-binding protein, partial [Calditrichia bacterium]